MYHLHTWNHRRKGRIKYCQIISVHPNSPHIMHHSSFPPASKWVFSTGFVKKNCPLIRLRMLHHCIFWHWKINSARELKRNLMCVSKFGEKTCHSEISQDRSIVRYSDIPNGFDTYRPCIYNLRSTHAYVCRGWLSVGKSWMKFSPWYCWWKKSCINWGRYLYPIIYQVSYIPGGGESPDVRTINSSPPSGMFFHTSFWPLR